MEGVGDLKRALLAIRDALVRSAAVFLLWSKRVYAMVHLVGGLPPPLPPPDDTVS